MANVGNRQNNTFYGNIVKASVKVETSNIQPAAGQTSVNIGNRLSPINSIGPVVFPTYTTTERNAELTAPVDGTVIYNSTDNALQVRANGAWANMNA